MLRHALPFVAAVCGAIMLAFSSHAVAAVPDLQVSGSNRIADARFDSFDESGCVVTFATVYLVTSTGHAAFGKERIPLSPNEAGVDVVIAQYQLCQGWPTPVWAKHGEALVYRPAFGWDGDGLSSATLDAPIEVCDVDLVTGGCVPGTAHNALVDLTWEGVGETTQYAGPAQVNLGLPYDVSVFSGAGAARSAYVSGSVIDGTTDYAAGVAGTGYLFRDAHLSLSLILGPQPS